MNSYPSYQDEELLFLVSQNDQAAFTELYQRYWQKLFGIAYNRLQETTLAEDIVHDVFASIWLNRSRLKIDVLENYLATATKYAVLALIRKKTSERSYLRSLEASPATDCTIEQSLHFKKLLDVIRLEVETLPEKCKLIFKCSREEGKPVKQIAAELNLSPKTVENQLGKAIRHLRLATKSILHSLF